MKFADIHIHLLFGADDGALDYGQMIDMLEAAYKDGARAICATPHFHPGYFGDNRKAADEAFEKLVHYAEKYDDLQLFRGNELRFSPSCNEWLELGECRTINGGKYILVDFAENEAADCIVSAMRMLLNSGYTPILAHAERYGSFSRDDREIIQLKELGTLIQTDAQSPFGAWGLGAKRRSRRLLKQYLADIVASDAHDTSIRPPQLSNCYKYVVKNCGEEYAERVFLNNPLKILNDSE